MSITNFEHQKLLMAHIQHTLQYTFHSPLRKREVRLKMGKSLDETKTAGEEPQGGTRSKSKTVNDSIHPRRRRSFDTKAWNSINKLRSSEQALKVGVPQLRAIRNGVAEVRWQYAVFLCL